MGNNKAYGFLKQVITAITSMAKSKTVAFKTKTRAIKTRLVIFSLLQNNKKLFVSSISHKLNALVGQQQKNHNNSIKPEEEEDDDDDDVDYGILGDGDHHQQSPSQPQAIVFYNNSNAMCRLPSACETETEIMELPLQQKEKGEIEEDDDGGELECKYPDLTHSLFDSEFEDPGRSVIDIVKNSKEDNGEEFRLEDEIDRVADLFIRRFHHQMRMQKQHSLKRHQEMLENSV